MHLPLLCSLISLDGPGWHGLASAGMPHFLADMWEDAWDESQLTRTFSMSQLKANIELIMGLIGFLCSLALFCYFTLQHRKLRASAPNWKYKRSLWTTDQINTCIIPLGLAIVFVVLHYSIH